MDFLAFGTIAQAILKWPFFLDKNIEVFKIEIFDHVVAVSPDINVHVFVAGPVEQKS